MEYDYYKKTNLRGKLTATGTTAGQREFGLFVIWVSTV